MKVYVVAWDNGVNRLWLCNEHGAIILYYDYKVHKWKTLSGESLEEQWDRVKFYTKAPKPEHAHRQVIEVDL